jgi:HSP20 family molecular chaperone IbpA
MRWEIQGPWPSMEEIERRFDDLIHSRWGMLPFEPSTDVLLGERELWFRLDLPGVGDSDFEVRRSGNLLVVEGARRSRRIDGAISRPHLTECWSGPFRRAIRVPEKFSQSEIDTDLRDGVLEVHLSREAEESE